MSSDSKTYYYTTVSADQCQRGDKQLIRVKCRLRVCPVRLLLQLAARAWSERAASYKETLPASYLNLFEKQELAMHTFRSW
jgi:hypothetical protein